MKSPALSLAGAHQSNRKAVLIGDTLGLYAAMSDGEAVSPEELASRTGTDERYVREWLCTQAASGYTDTTPTASASS
jgi:hypothetical protein